MNLVEIYESEIKPRIDYSKELADLEPVKKGDGRYLLICPNCRQKEAFLYENTGIIECNRKNNCAYKGDFLAYKNGGMYPSGADFVNAIKEMGSKYGIIIDEGKAESYSKQYQKRETDQAILSKVWGYFLSLIEGSKGAEYLKSRGFPIDQKQFGMYPKIEELKKWITENNLDLDRCQNLGLIRKDFEGRLIGVWKTKDREICNFWARSLDGSKPKYSRLANHPNLKQEYPQGSETIKGDRSIWVEGHLDVVAAYLSAFDGVVGCGTASVPDKALQALKSREVILCLDNDQAGRDGTYRFIEKHCNDDLKVFVAPIHHEDCKDLADVYEKHGDAAVHELFDQPRLIHGMSFAADYIMQKHRGDNWNDYTKTQALSELKGFSKKISSENSWKLSEFFWPEVSEGLDLPTEGIKALAESVEEKQQKEAITAQVNKGIKEFQEAFSNGEVERGKEILRDLNQEIQSHSASSSELQKLLKSSKEQDVIDELQKVSDGIYTGYDLGKVVDGVSDIVKLEIKGGAISVLAAPTSHGKTMALINFALGALENHPDKAVYFFTYEESMSAITTLFLNTYINETLSKNNRRTIKYYFRNLENNPFKYFIPDKKVPVSEGIEQPINEYFLKKKDQFFKELIESGRLNIVYCDHDASTLFELISGIHKKRDDLGLVCIDYMQLLNDSLDKGKRTSRQEELKSICLKMKNCAVDTGLPILVAAQFNREVQNANDMHYTRIGEAGDIERIANLILGMWNYKFKAVVKGNVDEKWMYDPKVLSGEMLFEVLKGREIGAGYRMEVFHNGNTGKIISRQDQDSLFKTL